jgi:hypothetical protein
MSQEKQSQEIQTVDHLIFEYLLVKIFTNIKTVAAVEKGRATPKIQSNDGQWGDMSGLSDKNVRIKFIRKVYLIVASQLIFSFSFICIFVFV